MTFISQTCGYKTIRPGDREFMINADLMVIPRASFEIDPSCPREYKLILQKCISQQWVRPVAAVSSQEAIFIALDK